MRRVSRLGSMPSTTSASLFTACDAFSATCRTRAEKKLSKQFNRTLKDLANALGSVRGLDVMIEALEKLGEKAEPSVRDGIAMIVGDCKQKRNDRRRDLEEFLTAEFVLDLRLQFNAVRRSVARRRVLAESNRSTT